MSDQNTTNILDWSALSTLDQPTIDSMPETMGEEFDRGIIGKAENASTDYRVLANSKTYTGTARNATYVGNPNSNSELDTVAWLNKDGIVRVTHFYPSKARDASNRGGVLGRHTLEFPESVLRDLSCPVLLYQLAVFIRIKQYRDELWWDSRNEDKWQSGYYSLAIPNDNKIKKDKILSALEDLKKGLLKVSSYISESNLIEFYEKILSSSEFNAPIFEKKNIPIEVFLALFLPLNEKDFSKLSFVLTIPKNWEVNNAKIKEDWDIIPNFNTHDMVLTQGNEASYQYKAEQYAKAIYSNTPSILSSDTTLVTLDDQPDIEDEVTPLSEDLHLKEEEEPEVTTTHRERLIELPSELDSNSNCYFYEILKGNEPYTDSDQRVKNLYNYLRSSKMYLKSSEYLQNPHELLSVDDKKLLEKWHQLLTKDKYNKQEDKTEVLFKIEYMKAVYLYLAMDEKTLASVLPNENAKLITQKIPLLLLFKANDRLSCDNLSKIYDSSEDNLLKKIFLQSLNLDMANIYQKEMVVLSKDLMSANKNFSEFLKNNAEITVAIEDIEAVGDPR